MEHASCSPTHEHKIFMKRTIAQRESITITMIYSIKLHTCVWANPRKFATYTTQKGKSCFLRENAFSFWAKHVKHAFFSSLTYRQRENKRKLRKVMSPHTFLHVSNKTFTYKFGITYFRVDKVSGVGLRWIPHIHVTRSKILGFWLNISNIEFFEMSPLFKGGFLWNSRNMKNRNSKIAFKHWKICKKSMCLGPFPKFTFFLIAS